MEIIIWGMEKEGGTVSSYSTKADMSGATESTAWKDYEASKPSEL